MTKDLAILVGPDQPWMTTEQFFDRDRHKSRNRDGDLGLTAPLERTTRSRCRQRCRPVFLCAARGGGRGLYRQRWSAWQIYPRNRPASPMRSSSSARRASSSRPSRAFRDQPGDRLHPRRPRWSGRAGSARSCRGTRGCTTSRSPTRMRSSRSPNSASSCCCSRSGSNCRSSGCGRCGARCSGSARPNCSAARR